MEKEKVLVVGTGKSGIAATQLLVKTGKLPVLFDSNAELKKDEILGKLSLSDAEKEQVEIVLGDLTEEEKKTLSSVVLSPGVPTDTEFVNDLRDRGLTVSGEIELAFEQEKGAGPFLFSLKKICLVFHIFFENIRHLKIYERNKANYDIYKK